MIQAPNAQSTAMSSSAAKQPQADSLLVHQSIAEEKEEVGSVKMETDQLYEKLKELESQWMTQRCIVALSYNLDDDHSTSSLSDSSCQNAGEEKSDL